MRKYQPAAYMKICALLVPREMKVEPSGGIKAMSTEQIERSIELIKEVLAKREAAANAKVIEGETEVVPSLPGAGSAQEGIVNKSTTLVDVRLAPTSGAKADIS